jgi:hypothetical protein
VAALEVMLPEITDERPRDSKYQNKQKAKKAHKRTLVDGKISDYIRAIERHLKNLNLEGEEKLAHQFFISVSKLNNLILFRTLKHSFRTMTLLFFRSQK